MLLATVGFFNTALYAWSSGVINIATTAVLFETWPIMLVLLMRRLYRKEGRYLKVGLFTMFSFVLALIGVMLVITSQGGGIEQLVDLSGSSSTELTLGATLALGAAVMTALSAFGFRWGSDVTSELASKEGRSRESREVYGVIIGSLAVCACSIPFMALIGIARGEVFKAGNAAFGFAIAPFLGTLPTVLWRRANLLSDNLGLNIFMYLTPLISLAWLMSLALVTMVDVTLLVFGAVVIVAANFGVYIDGRQSQQKWRQMPNTHRIISGGESGTVEFKPSLRMNLYTYKPEKRVEFGILKTVAAFMNSEGGTLIVGVADDQQPIGIHFDGFDNEDKINLHLRNIVSTRMGATAMTQLHTSFEDYEGVRIMVVRCDPASQPVYLRGADNAEVFYIRAGPTSTKLSLRESNDYIRGRFQ